MIGLIKKYPRWFLTFFAMAACAWAVIRWSFLGLMASKLIGLPQYALAMQKQEQQSRTWGVAAVVLGAIVLGLASLPEKQRSVPQLPAHASLTYSLERNRWTSLLERWLIRTAVAALGTLGFVVVFMLGVYIWGEIALHVSR